MSLATKLRLYSTNSRLLKVPFTFTVKTKTLLSPWHSDLSHPPQQPPPHLQNALLRSLCTKPTIDNDTEKKTINTKVNFSPSDSDSDSDSDSEENRSEEIDKSKLPPPYDPFNKKPIIEEPDDPSNLQLIFHKMRSDGLFNNAVKMFDELSKQGLTHEALELFSQIKNKGHMPDVVAYTAVIEAYSNASGQSKEAVKSFMKMLAAGVAPNAYTYGVLIKGLAGDGQLSDARKYVLEMMVKGMRPNPATYTALFEAFAKSEKMAEAKALLQEMKDKGFVPDEKGVRQALSNKRGQVFRNVISILFDK